MFKMDIQCLAALSILLCGVSLTSAVLKQEALRLNMNCFQPYFGYVIPGSQCTCSKASPETEGLVQWVFPNGTVAKQTSNSQNGTSILTTESPHKYALNQTYLCRLINSQGQASAAINHTFNFIFGPISPSLKWISEPNKNIYICPSNETKELTLSCDVEAATVNPNPIYTIFVDGNRYGAYDKLPGKLENGVWRHAITFKFTTLGNHTVNCHVRNLYAAFNWSTLTKNITVLERPVGSSEC